MTIEIKTDRLILRPPVMEDAPRIVELLNVAEVALQLGRVPFPYGLDDAHWWIDKAATDHASDAEYAFGVYLPGEGLIGSCGLMRAGAYWEIGYWFGQAYWGKGYATEAGRAVLDWARGKGIDGFVSGHIADNPASGTVLKKLGFEPVGETVMYARGRDARVPAIRYVLNAPADAALAPDDHGGGDD